MRVATLLLGMVLLALGIAGFVPAFNTDGKVFGLLPENIMMSGLMALTGLIGVLIATLKRPDLATPTRHEGNDLRSWM
jgi:hypothetical protein